MISPHGNSFAPHGAHAHLKGSWSSLSGDNFVSSPETLPGNCLACVPEQPAIERHTCPSVHKLRVLLASIIQSTKFEWAAVLLIVLNTSLIGVEQRSRLNGHDWAALEVCEHLFLGFFSIEIIARVFAFGLGCFRSRWVVFDFILISVSVLVTWIIPLFADGLSESLGVFMVMRSARLLRLGRTLRLLMRSKELCVLVQGLLGSAHTILYTLVLLSALTYMFASMGIELITKNPKADPTGGDPEFARIVEENFATLEGTMLTLIQFLTLDSIGAIYKPLVRKEPYLILYFAAVIILLAIVLMNLITAAVVNSALDQATQDKAMVAMELQRKKAMCIRDLSALFRRIDTDESGTVTREEFSAVMRETGDDTATVLQTVFMAPEEIFDALDVSDDDEVSIEEFCEVLWAASNDRSSVDIKRTEKKLDVLKAMLEECFADPAGWRRKGQRQAGAATTDTVRPLAMERREPPPRVPFYEHQEAVGDVLDPGNPGEASPCSETCNVSPQALLIPARANANAIPEPSWQGAEVALPRWAACINETLVKELQATRQMLVQEVHRACLGVYESTAPTPPGKLPVHPGMPHEDTHYDSAVHAKPVTGAPPRGLAPQAPAARQTDRPSCLMEGEASNEPSAWRSRPFPDFPNATIQFGVHREPRWGSCPFPGSPDPTVQSDVGRDLR